MTALVTLRDNSQVPLATLKTVSGNLAQLAKKPTVLFDLLSKCREDECKIEKDSANILRKFHLIDENEDIVSRDVKSIVLNSVKVSVSMRMVNPIKNQVAKL